MLAKSILVPNVLGKNPDEIEELFTLLTNSSRYESNILDMSSVTWIHPYGAISLLGICRYLSHLTQEPVRLVGLQRNIHAYLRRIDFFACDNGSVTAMDRFNPTDDFGRNPSSSSVLELIPIRSYQDVYLFASRARPILSSWLSNNDDIDRIITLVSEACGNIVAHSGKSGTTMIQKYERASSTDIELAISDLGQGIRQSLLAQHETLSDTDSGFITRAINGLSGRPDASRGQGLGAIQDIAIKSGGSLHIRSEKGSVRTTASERAARDDLSFFPGTHIAITFCSTSAR